MYTRLQVSVNSLLKKYRISSLTVYNISTLLIVVGLMFSRASISIGFILFITNWFIEGNFHLKWQRIKSNLKYLVICLILLLHMAGLIHSDNWIVGLTDLKIKLPLLFPIFWFSSSIAARGFKNELFLKLFALVVLFAGIFGVVRFEVLNSRSLEDIYKIAILGQNIQVAVFAVFAVCIVIYLVFAEKEKESLAYKFLIGCVLIWFTIHIYILNSYTGYFAILVMILFSTIYYYKKIGTRLVTIVFIVFFISVSSLIYTITDVWQSFQYHGHIQFENLPDKTVNGNYYTHDSLSRRVENGNPIDIYISEKELKVEWEKKSPLEYHGTDYKKQELSETLIRYLSSKGLTKDSAGLAKLDGYEIGLIENGCANYLYAKPYDFKTRIYHVLWQLNTYYKTGNSTAQSFSQRLDFMKASKIIITNNFWFGVGSGDVLDSFRKTLSEMPAKLHPDYFNRVHNQFIVEFVALGLLGFFAFVIVFFYPVFRFKIWKSYILSGFYILVFISFLTDNPLETQLGVSFFIVFYCLLFSLKTIEPTSKEVGRY
jgi:hypothetical protein